MCLMEARDGPASSGREKKNALTLNGQAARQAVQTSEWWFDSAPVLPAPKLNRFTN
ncbi:MAG: hypothetical protein [Bacteriophage sp.]|nr:MAG: hypothetical protein [Bacteriophage sp.]